MLVALQVAFSYLASKSNETELKFENGRSVHRYNIIIRICGTFAFCLPLWLVIYFLLESRPAILLIISPFLIIFWFSFKITNSVVYLGKDEVHVVFFFWKKIVQFKDINKILIHENPSFGSIKLKGKKNFKAESFISNYSILKTTLLKNVKKCSKSVKVSITQSDD